VARGGPQKAHGPFYRPGKNDIGKSDSRIVTVDAVTQVFTQVNAQLVFVQRCIVIAQHAGAQFDAAGAEDDP
jgi:hypothetical protein